MNLKAIFGHKKIIHSKQYKSAELVKFFKSNGKLYARVLFTNRMSGHTTMPSTDIAKENILIIQRMPSKFDKWLYGLFGEKPHPKIIAVSSKLVNKSKLKTK
jgi:hypothetical protein